MRLYRIYTRYGYTKPMILQGTYKIISFKISVKRLLRLNNSSRFRLVRNRLFLITSMILINQPPVVFLSSFVLLFREYLCRNETLQRGQVKIIHETVRAIAGKSLEDIGDISGSLVIDTDAVSRNKRYL